MKNNIFIRKVKIGDEVGLADMRKEGLLRKNWIYIGSRDLPDKKLMEKWRKRFADKNGESYMFVAVDKNTGKIVGSIHAIFKKRGRLRHRVDLGWMVHPDYQGRGIGTMLLRNILIETKKRGFKRVDAEVVVENKASLNLAKKLGFKIEGRKKDGFLMDNGKYVDIYVIGKVLK